MALLVLAGLSLVLVVEKPSSSASAESFWLDSTSLVFFEGVDDVGVATFVIKDVVT